MAKRFINTEIFEDAWFSDLPSKYKLFWIYILTRCNHAGVWQVNFKHACFNVGDHLEPSECERIFRERIVKIEDGKYWFLPKFITFQYGTKLSPRNKVHIRVIEILEKYNLYKYLNSNNLKNEEDDTLQAPTEELASSLQGAKEKDKVKDKDMVKEKDKEKDKEIEERNFYSKKEEKLEEEPPDLKTSNLLDFIKTNAPRVNKLKYPVTAAECKILLEDFDEFVIRDTLLDMENYKKLLTCYESANLTLRKWVKQRIDSGSGEITPRKFYTPPAARGTKFKYTDPIEAMKNDGF